MKPSERLQQSIRTTGVPIWHPGSHSGFSRTLSPATMTGAELTEHIADALKFQTKLQKCIVAMAAVLDTGETPNEHAARIAAEDADPKTAAEKYGWFAIEDLATLCDKSESGFYQHIKNCRGQVVKPHTYEYLIGPNWERYPGRSFYWADHVRHARDWADALQMERVDQEKALQKAWA